MDGGVEIRVRVRLLLAIRLDPGSPRAGGKVLTALSLGERAAARYEAMSDNETSPLPPERAELKSTKAQDSPHRGAGETPTANPKSAGHMPALQNQADSLRGV